MRTRHFELLRPGEIIAERERCPVVYVPIGPLEWHSVHLPYGVDPLNAAAVALAVAERAGGVVLPPFFWGTERERSPALLRAIGLPEDAYVVGMGHPAHALRSLYCREEFLALLVRELVEGLVLLEYRLIVIVNGHGAENQVATLERLARELSATTPARVLVVGAWPAVPVRGLEMSHAGATESAEIMALHPESVDLSQLPPAPAMLRIAEWGILDAETVRGEPTPDHTLHESADPRLHASAELGRELLVLAAEEAERAVRAALGALTP